MSGYLYHQKELRVAQHQRPKEMNQLIEQNNCVKYVQDADAAKVEAMKTVDWFIDCGDDDFTFKPNLELIMAMQNAGGTSWYASATVATPGRSALCTLHCAAVCLELLSKITHLIMKNLILLFWVVLLLSACSSVQKETPIDIQSIKTTAGFISGKEMPTIQSKFLWGFTVAPPLGDLRRKPLNRLNRGTESANALLHRPRPCRPTRFPLLLEQRIPDSRNTHQRRLSLSECMEQCKPNKKNFR